MNKNYRFIFVFLSLVSVIIVMSGCQNVNKKVLDYSVVAVSSSDLEVLEQYPNLQTLDLCGSSCYEAIEAYVASHPQVDVKYDVQIGSNRYSDETKKLTFEDGEFEFDQLLTNLVYLPELTELDLPQTTLSYQQISEIYKKYPDLAIDYSVVVLGEAEARNTTVLDLSAMQPEQMDEIAAQLAFFPDLTKIILTDENGQSALSPADVKKLYDTVPGVSIDYSFELFGKKLTTADEVVEYVDVKIGNEGVEKIRQALDIMPECTYFKLDSCGIDNEVMAKLRDDYPNVKIVWRIIFCKTSYLTDVEMIHWARNEKNEDLQVLKYCTDVLYLDLGHNFLMTDINFINYMPKLKIAILVDSKISSLEPLANCPDLEHLEIVNCNRLKDLSPLANCKKLKRLNISSSFGITDLSPIFEHKDMERLYAGGNKNLRKQIEKAKEMLPNCWVTNVGGERRGVSGNYAVGWRLEKDLRFAEWYKEMREIFRYDVRKW